MKYNQHIVKYVVVLNRLAGHIGYDDVALCCRFYHSLPGHIKTQIMDLGKPNMLVALHAMAQAIDVRHWEHEAEIQCEQNHSGKSSDKSHDKSKASNTHNTTAKSTTRANNSSTFSTSGAKSTTPNLLLGKDGKLLPAECQHHIANNLCLFCGGSNHQVKDCPHSTSSTAKAHVVTVAATPTT